MSEIRPLPPRPSLEFERKEAKALLKELRTGDPGAVARVKARHPALGSTRPEDFQLADAQLTIAREYGFASWPKLVKYFENAERLLKRTPSAVNPGLYRPEAYPGTVQNFIERHRRRSVSAARSLVAYVPRLYGASLEEAFNMEVSEDEARLVVARGNGFVSWDALMARVNARANDPSRRNGFENAPRRSAFDAIRAADLSRLQEIVASHPELVAPTEDQIATSEHLLTMALERERIERDQGANPERLQPIIRWLASAGFDVQRELNIRLCGDMRMKPEDVQYWIDRGADPNWVAPNGYTVLEHAIVRYENPAAIDLLARYANEPRPALWIAAGLGDVAGVARFLDHNGKPTEAARIDRPQFDAIAPRAFAFLPGDDGDETLAEAVMVAFLNERTAVVEYLVARGFPVNTLRFDMPRVVMAVGNNKLELVEALIRAGADLDLRGAYNGSAREMARDMLLGQRADATRRRIAGLCGLDSDAILAERDAQPLPTPEMHPRLREELALASDDARRLGLPAVTPENLFFGMLRREGLPLMFYARVSEMDAQRFGRDFEERLRHGEGCLDGASLPLDGEAQTLLDEATAAAAQRRRETVRGDHLLATMLKQADGVAAQLLVRYGSSAEKLLEQMERSL